MQTVYMFLLGLAITIALSVAVVHYLKSPLRDILTDLCGNERRADFWTAFTSAILILAPALFAMEFHSAPSQDPQAIFQLTYQLKWSLAGLVASMLTLGAILNAFIRKSGSVRG